MSRQLMTKGNDLASCSIGRVFKHYLLSRCIPLGFYRGGAGLRCLIALSFTHHCGRPLFWFVTRFERHMARLYRLLRRGA